MNRADVKAARDEAKRFVALCDGLLATQAPQWHEEGGWRQDGTWAWTSQIAGKKTGAHRRASLDLTRALAHMRRRL